MKKKILIVTSSIDCTVDYLIEKYSSRLEFFRLNVDFLGKYEVSIGSEAGWCVLDKEKNEYIRKDDIFSIYYRKPMFPDLKEYEKAYHQMIQSDIYAIIAGIVNSFEGKVLSKPYLLRKAENKVDQIIFAQKNNWIIPKSFIGNRTVSQMEYLQKKSIIKPLTTGKVYNDKVCEIYQTNIFTSPESSIDLTPIYLQEYIDKQYEVRLTIMNQIFFTVRIDTKNKVDWRKDYENHVYSLIDCPIDIQQKCLEMLSYYKLKFGAFDFIVTPNNEWVFLELNPNGQWLWLEKALNINISKEIINFLEETEYDN